MMPAKSQILDAVGVGFGPANIAVAIALREMGSRLKVRFLERNSKGTWQPGMLFPDSDIQNHPLRDLATPRNPKSHFSFTNFLFEHGRLFEFLNLGLTFPFRTEYEQYIAWAAGHFGDQVEYSCEVADIAIHDPAGAAPIYKVTTRNGVEYWARSVIVAPGRTPYIPKAFRDCRGERVIHLTSYMETVRRRSGDPGMGCIAVVGGSQSAVEIILHASSAFPSAEIHGLSRTFGYRQKDTGPFTGEVYFPKFVDLFFHASKQEKKRLIRDLHLTNYSSADADVLDRLYRLIYQEKLAGRERISIRNCADIQEAVETPGGLQIAYRRIGTAGIQRERYDLAILATGFRNIGIGENEEACPPILRGIKESMDLDEDGCLVANEDYSLSMREAEARTPPCYLNGLCESSHGMGDAGSFSLLALRSQVICDSLEARLGGGEKTLTASVSGSGDWCL